MLGCDCHVHVFGPVGRFPFSGDRKYTPPEALVGQLRAHLRALGLERVVIVQPSPYGTDNSCTIDSLIELGSRARGIAVIDNTSNLEQLHEAGIRGVRVNLETAGERDPAVARRRLGEMAARVAPLGWHVQVFADFSLINELQTVIEALPVPLAIDHFGLARSRDDCDVLLSLLERGNVYVKLSAPHRLTIDATPLARALIAARPDRLLWGSDWPHPPGGRRSPGQVQPFDAIDDARALQRLAEWAPDANSLEKILVENPARLYDF